MAEIIAKDGSIMAHPFEAAGLGKAPFRFLGVSEEVYKATPDAPAQPGGKCDYCGMAIRYCFQIASADGKRFAVGSDCVEKTDTSKLRVVVASEMRKMKREKARIYRAEKQKRDAVTCEEIRAEYEAAAAKLQSEPHPYEYMAEKGYTLGGYFDFCVKQSEPTKRLKYMRQAIKRAASVGGAK